MVNAALNNHPIYQDAGWSLTIPGNTFVDIDAGDTLTFSATQANGQGLPGWISFDGGTRTFSGTPRNADVGSLGLTVSACDTSGATVSANFQVNINPVLPADFDGQTYLYLNPDVAQAGMDASYHWLNHGRFEHRTWTTGRQGDRSTLLPAGFDGEIYWQLNPDVAQAGRGAADVMSMVMLEQLTHALATFNVPTLSGSINNTFANNGWTMPSLFTPR